MQTPTQLFIDGEWRAGSRPAFAVHDPASTDEIATVQNASPDDALAAVNAAASARPAWAAAPPRTRSEVLRRAFELMITHTDELAELITRENGKPIAEARGEVAYGAEFFRWFAEEAVRLDGQLVRAPNGANRIMVLHQAIGVALAITPWNFPAAMATRKLAPALAAGCSVVLKPAEQTPLTALRLAELLSEAGVPPGVVNVVPTDDPAPFTRAVLEHPAVRKISFTGSTEVGRELLALAADRVLRSSMELGGNAPFVVCDDADLDAAVEGAMLAKMRHNAQTCTAANRFYVHDRVADDFAARLTARMTGLRTGPGIDPTTELGPLIDHAAVQKVGALLDSALAGGAREWGRGDTPDLPGSFFPAVVIDDVAPDAAILDDEIFGPVAPIVRFGTDDDAIAMANDTTRGLVAYVYSQDLSRALRFAEAFETGMVGVNRGVVSDPAAPFGGAKQSGIGREGGHEGILEFTETKYVALDW
ncbi:MAG: NAD-dependent succinate-semialdehyde dehydrogenase [Acidimicrobiia bacterium]